MRPIHQLGSCCDDAHTLSSLPSPRTHPCSRHKLPSHKPTLEDRLHLGLTQYPTAAFQTGQNGQPHPPGQTRQHGRMGPPGQTGQHGQTASFAPSQVPALYTYSLQELPKVLRQIQTTSSARSAVQLSYVRSAAAAVQRFPEEQRPICEALNLLHGHILFKRGQPSRIDNSVPPPSWLPSAKTGCIAGLTRQWSTSQPEATRRGRNKRSKLNAGVELDDEGNRKRGRHDAGEDSTTHQTLPAYESTEQGLIRGEPHLQQYVSSTGTALAATNANGTAPGESNRAMDVEGTTSQPISLLSQDVEQKRLSTGQGNEGEAMRLPEGVQQARAEEDDSVSALVKVLSDEQPSREQDWGSLRIQLERIAQHPEAAQKLQSLSNCSELGLKLLCEELLTDSCTYLAAQAVLSTTLLPHVQRLGTDASPALAQACHTAAQHHSKALLEGVLKPMVQQPGLVKAQVKLLAKVVNKSLPVGLRHELFVAALRHAPSAASGAVLWSEGHVELLQALLDKKAEVFQEDLPLFVACVEAAAQVMQKNVSLLKLVLTMLNMHGTKLSPKLASNLQAPIWGTQTFLTKQVLARLEKLLA